MRERYRKEIIQCREKEKWNIIECEKEKEREGEKLRGKMIEGGIDRNA